MPWVPTTDFEEEIVNLQPDHDFIYGALSEPEPQQSYPRPKAHIEYAHNLKKQAQKQQEQYEATGRLNEKLHVITQVQRMTGTKPLGEQPTIEDWDSVKNVEKETVGMMRFYGIGSSVEQPLNHKVTISSYPVRNDIQVVKTGSRKVPLFFDDNVFKLKPKVSNSSSGFESASSSNSNDFMANNDDSHCNNSSDTSFNTSGSSINNSNSFYTGQNDTADDLSSSKKDYIKAQMERETLLLKAERLRQYEKLHEETASLSLSNQSRDNASFHTANDSSSSWTPSVLYEYDDEDASFDKNKTKWPGLNDFIPSKTWYSRNSASNNNSFDSAQDQYCGNDDSTSGTSSCSNLYQTKSSNFLQRFIKPENNNTSIASTSSKASIECPSPTIPLSYANVAKSKSILSPVVEAPSQSQGAISKSKIKVQNMPQFFTAREIYEKKRNGV